MKKLLLIAMSLAILPAFAFDRKQIVAAGEAAANADKADSMLESLDSDHDAIAPYVQLQVNWKTILIPVKDMTPELKDCLAHVLIRYRAEQQTAVEHILKTEKR